METKTCRGATLIELLVVLIVIALVSSIVGPAIAKQVDNISLQSAATQLAAQFRKAQALARADDSAVLMTYADRQFRFFEQSGDKTRLFAAYDLPASISVVSTDFGVYLFLPSGQIVAPGRVELKNTRGRAFRIETDILKGVGVAPAGS